MRHSRRIRWLKLYPGKYKVARHYSPLTRPEVFKIIVFDLDETLGYFADLHILWNSLFYSEWSLTIIPDELKHLIFAELFELYPEFLRFGILRILRFLHRNIRDNKCGKILLYTNNQCRYPEWIKLILYYIDRKVCPRINETIFDKPICAFKIGERIIECTRTSKDKTHGDMITCAKLPLTAEICYIDDTYYPEMEHANVYYIQPPAYYHGLSHHDICNRLLMSKLYYNLITTGIVSNKYKTPQFSHFDEDKRINNKEVYTELYDHIRGFFTLSSTSSLTRKYIRTIGRFTRRKK